MADWKKTKCGTCVYQRKKPICNSCLSFQLYRPMTNADRIRAMSDEELAELLEKIVSGNRDVIGINCGDSKCEIIKCTGCIKVWLQSEAE